MKIPFVLRVLVRAALVRLCRRAALIAAPLIILFAFSTPIHAQESTGTIRGRVLNARTGNYLSKARVQIGGSGVAVLTNDFGEYRIENVPAGALTLQVTYTGQDPLTVPVTVTPGATLEQDVTFGATTGEASALRLNPFVVESERFKTAQEIAVNEERFSVNMKNVVAADAFGEIPSGNIGEFIKYLPGIELEYGGTYTSPTDAAGISVRGFGAMDTAIYIDGVPVSSASQASLTTQVELDMLSINNASRVELIKVPTPDMPMDSVGGQINLISKSAFEYSKPVFSWQAYVTINSENPNPFERIPGPRAEKVRAGQPGFNFSYIHPVSKTLGLTLTASTYSQFSENRRFRPEWGTGNVNVDMRPFGGANSTPTTNDLGPVSLANPYLSRVSLTDAPRTSRSYSASLKADWKPFPGLALAGSYQISTYKSADAARRIQLRTQRPMDWDATSTISFPYVPASESANGSTFNPGNSLEMNIDSRDKEGITHTGSLRATYQRGPWDIFALASISTSRASFKDLENGHFSTVDLEAEIGQVKFENIADGIPGKVTVLDRSGAPFDFTQLDDWEAEIRGRSGKAESMDDKIYYKFDIKRQLDFLPWENTQFALKAGWERKEEIKKKWGFGTNYRETYVGPDLTADDYLDTTYLNQDPGFGFPAQEWISTYRLYDIYAANPDNFTVTPGDARENWFSHVGQNKRIREVRDSLYAQLEGSTKVFNRRLSFIAGLRDSGSKRTGRGPMGDGRWNFIKEDNGTLYRNQALLGGSGLVRIDQANSPLFAQTATGNALRADLNAKGISFPTSMIASATLEGAMLQRRLLAPVEGESKGDPSYSINLAYDLTSKLKGQVAWSRTFGRIPIEAARAGLLSGNQNDFNISEEEDPTEIPRGSIKLANPNLQPEISDNWDFGLSYYTDSGGKLGASFYTKKVKNFSESIKHTQGSAEFNAILATLGLDPTEYQDWEIETSVNGIGSGDVKGYELEAHQDLRFLPFLGEWGRRVHMFGTYSHSKRSEANTTRISARPAASALATGGINLSTNRFTVNLRASWTDLKFINGAGNFTINGVTYQLGTYDPSTTKVDANFEWRFLPKYSLYVSGKNIFASGLRRERMDLGGIYPAYAHWDDLREFGVQWTIGIKGRF